MGKAGKTSCVIFLNQWKQLKQMRQRSNFSSPASSLQLLVLCGFLPRASQPQYQFFWHTQNITRGRGGCGWENLFPLVPSASGSLSSNPLLLTINTAYITLFFSSFYQSTWPIQRFRTADGTSSNIGVITIAFWSTSILLTGTGGLLQISLSQNLFCRHLIVQSTILTPPLSLRITNQN